MIYQQRVKFKIIVISIALLVGQFFALIHSVKHPFHQPIESCRIYFAFEQSGNGLICEGIATISPILQPYVWIGFFSFPRACVTAIDLRADTQVCPYEIPYISWL